MILASWFVAPFGARPVGSDGLSLRSGAFPRLVALICILLRVGRLVFRLRLRGSVILRASSLVRLRAFFLELRFFIEGFVAVCHLFLDAGAIDEVLSSLFEIFGFDFQIGFIQFRNLVLKSEFEVVKIVFIFSKVLKLMVTDFSLLISDFFAFFLHFYLYFQNFIAKMTFSHIKVVVNENVYLQIQFLSFDFLNQYGQL